MILIILSFLASSSGMAGQPEQAKDIPVLTLTDCVVLALKNNLDLRSAYLDRAVQRINLKVAEYKFKPHTAITLESRINSVYDDFADKRTTGDNQSGGFNVSLTIPTGGSFNFSWDSSADRADFNQDYLYNPSWNLTFIQPLLKGGGTDVNTASVKIARINEEQNVLALRGSVMNLITSTAQAYRNYTQSRRQLEINKRSLEMAEKLFEINKALIEAGRMAEVELVQTEADIANRKVGILQSENSIEAARLALLRILNLDKSARFETLDETMTKAALPSLEEAFNIAFNNRPDYLQSLLNLETAKLNMTVAKRNQLWELSLKGGVGRSVSGSNYGDALELSGNFDKADWDIGLQLTIPIADPAIEQEYVSAKVGLEKTELSLKKLKTDIGIEVENALRDAEIKYQQLELAGLAVKLSRKKLETENEKLNAGRSTNFQLLTFQNDLVSAELSELSAMIDYLNLLTSLDQTLGATLATWKVEVTKDDDEITLPEAKKPSSEKE